MRLYHWTRLALLALLLLAGCAPQVSQGQITVDITADGKQFQIRLEAGSTVAEALAAAGLTVNELDRSEPPAYTVLSDGSQVRLVRVREEFYIEQVVIPFEHQVLRNESLPAGETRLSQPGVEGLQEVTYRRVYEDEVETSSSVVKTVVVREAVPEIVMLGSQTPFASLTIPGRMAYLSAGNAWIMDETTGNRRPVVTTGDLDGQVFALSPDGDWLLFTRTSQEENTINSLWVARLDDESGQMIDLGASNIVHFAGWGPGLSVVAYSTVEPRATAPGWQANNDLFVVGVSDSGFVAPPRLELEANSGGVYGWWGMDFSWSNDGIRLAYARPDGIGILDTRQVDLLPLQDIIPFQTGSDWAWVPGVAWSPDNRVIYTVDHVAPQGAAAPEESPRFDLLAIPLEGGAPVHLVSDVGMFAYPSPSPLQAALVQPGSDESGPLVENAYQVAYLQAIFPAQSETSRYRLVVMDRDGSNRRVFFPEQGAPGLDPQRVTWSPAPLGGNGGYSIAVLYQGNIWLVNLADGLAQQITGDGLAVRVDWK